MAYSHNLSDPSDISSGYDPVAGIPDGSTVGGTFVVRQLFGGLTAFDSNVQEITASNTACPAWLMPLSGNLLGNVAMNQTSSSLYIRWFRADDPGLTASTPNCFIYYWSKVNSTGINRNLLLAGMEFAVSGVGIKVSKTNDSPVDLWRYNTDNSAGVSLYYSPRTSTTTTMSDWPKAIFWKSNNSIFMVSVRKTDNAFVGGGCISLHPKFSGYTLTGSVSGNIINGVNTNLVIYLGNAGQQQFLDGFTTEYDSTRNASTRLTEYSLLPSVGKLPNVSLSLSGNLRLISQKFAVAICTDNNVITAVSEEIDNVYLISTGIMSSGTIVLYDGKYWLCGGYTYDGIRNNPYLLQLSG